MLIQIETPAAHIFSIDAALTQGWEDESPMVEISDDDLTALWGAGASLDAVYDVLRLADREKGPVAVEVAGYRYAPVTGVDVPRADVSPLDAAWADMPHQVASPVPPFPL